MNADQLDKACVEAGVGTSSDSDVAGRLGVTRPAVHHWRVNHGVPSHRAPTDDAIGQMARDGKNADEIAAAPGVSSRRVWSTAGRNEFTLQEPAAPRGRERKQVLAAIRESHDLISAGKRCFGEPIAARGTAVPAHPQVRPPGRSGTDPCRAGDRWPVSTRDDRVCARTSGNAELPEREGASAPLNPARLRGVSLAQQHSLPRSHVCVN
jgi:hypothetical protein